MSQWLQSSDHDGRGFIDWRYFLLSAVKLPELKFGETLSADVAKLRESSVEKQLGLDAFLNAPIWRDGGNGGIRNEENSKRATGTQAKAAIFYIYARDAKQINWRPTSRPRFKDMDQLQNELPLCAVNDVSALCQALERFLKPQ